jgi:lipoate-protein ligase B
MLKTLSRRLYSTTVCNNGLVQPLNNNPIGYLTLPGLVKYDAGLKLQKALVARRHQITRGTLKTDIPADIICFLEHPPTFTAGRRIRGKTDLDEEARLKELGADYFEVN